MANTRNCRRCGKVFNYIAGPPICQACKEELEAKFQQVKDYVREHRTANMAEIVRDCDVREERLVFADDSPIKPTCEKCGAPILTGRFCENCKKETAGAFADLAAAGTAAKNAGAAAAAARAAGTGFHIKGR